MAKSPRGRPLMEIFESQTNISNSGSSSTRCRMNDSVVCDKTPLRRLKTVASFVESPETVSGLVLSKVLHRSVNSTVSLYKYPQNKTCLDFSAGCRHSSSSCPSSSISSSSMTLNNCNMLNDSPGMRRHLTSDHNEKEVPPHAAICDNGTLSMRKAMSAGDDSRAVKWRHSEPDSSVCNVTASYEDLFDTAKTSNVTRIDDDFYAESSEDTGGASISNLSGLVYGDIDRIQNDDENSGKAAHHAVELGDCSPHVRGGSGLNGSSSGGVVSDAIEFDDNDVADGGAWSLDPRSTCRATCQTSSSTNASFQPQVAFPLTTSAVICGTYVDSTIASGGSSGNPISDTAVQGPQKRGFEEKSVCGAISDFAECLYSSGEVSMTGNGGDSNCEPHLNIVNVENNRNSNNNCNDGNIDNDGHDNQDQHCSKCCYLTRLSNGRDDEIVVVKKIQKYRCTPLQIMRCYREAEMLQFLRHPNVIQLLSFHDEDDEISLVFELAQYGDLHQWTSFRALAEDIVKKLTLQLLKGLTYIHSNGIIHCDIKPHNILLFNPSPPSGNPLRRRRHRYDPYSGHVAQLPFLYSSALPSSITTTEKYSNVKHAPATLNGTSLTHNPRPSKKTDSSLKYIAAHKSTDVSPPSFTEATARPRDALQSYLSGSASGGGVDCKDNQRSCVESSPFSNSSDKFDNKSTDDSRLKSLSSINWDNVCAKICDFGLAQYANADGMLHFAGVLGSQGFIAPEILFNHNYGQKADVWSVGSIVFRLLGGYDPYYPASDCIKVPLEFDERYWSEISWEAKDFVSQTMLRDPSLRLSSHEALHHQWFTSFC